MNKEQKEKIIEGLTILIEDELKKFEEYTKNHRPSSNDNYCQILDDYFPKSNLKKLFEKYNCIERKYALKGSGFISNII
jgi:hypothetical protein